MPQTPVKPSKKDSAFKAVLPFILAATVGWSLSGGFFQASRMLRPFFRIIPRNIYANITTTLISFNIASWMALYIDGLKQLFQPTEKSNEESIKAMYDNHIEQMRTYLLIEEINTYNKNFNITEKQMKSIRSRVLDKSEILEYWVRQKLHEKAHSLPSEHHAVTPTTLESFISLIPGVRNVMQAFRDYRDGYEQHLSSLHVITKEHITPSFQRLALERDQGIENNKRKGDSAEEALMKQQEKEIEQCEEATEKEKGVPRANAKDKELISITVEAILRDLPAIPIGSMSELAYYLCQSFVWIMTLCYSFLANNITFMMLGGTAFISLARISHPVLAYTILSYFFCVGTLSAVSFSKPGAMAGFKKIYPFGKKETDYLSKIRKNADTNGIFAFPLWLQKPFAFLLALSIAIVNFSANIAFGQVLFAGKSIFDPTLFASAMFTPFSAHPYSIALGAVGGIAALSTLSLLLIGGVMDIRERPQVPRSTQKTHKILMLLSSLPLFIKVVSCLPYQQFSAPLSQLGYAMMLIYNAYNICRAKEHGVVSNLAVAVNIIVGSFLTYYFNAPLFAKILPQSIANSLAGACAIANADLTLPILNRRNLDTWSDNIQRRLVGAPKFK